jgi:hypothetical protein
MVSTQASDVKNLIEAVGSLPLATVQAATYKSKCRHLSNPSIIPERAQWRGVFRYTMTPYGNGSLDTSMGERLDVLPGAIGDSHL